MKAGIKALLWAICATMLLAGIGVGAALAEELPISVPEDAPITTTPVTTAPPATVPVTTAPPATVPVTTASAATDTAAGTVATEPAAPTAPFIAPGSGSIPAVAGAESGYDTAAGLPRTRTVDITGTYHMDQGLFEQNFANKFFYTDIENGGMTGNAVYVELPAGINVRMERDGVAAAFVNRMNIVEPGAYVLYLSFTDEQGALVNGVFRFRIASRDETAGNSADPGLSLPDETAMTDEEINALIDSYIYGDAGGGVAGTGGAARTLTGNGVYTGLDELYDSRTGMFLETTVSERAFYSSIPNGAVVDFPAAFNFPAQFGEINVTRNGETYPYVPGGTISEDGAYCMTFGGGDLAALTASGPPPSFNFRIITQPSADLDIYNAPWGYRITQAVRDGEPLNYQGNVVMMKEDGVYTIELAAESAEAEELTPEGALPEEPASEEPASEESASEEPAPEGLTLEFTRDTTAPEYQLIGVQNGKSTGLEVTVEYWSDDVASAQLFKDGAEVRFHVNDAVSDPGIYYLVVYDRAGNYAAAEFEMLYRMNTVSVGLIFGIVGLLAFTAVLVLLRGRRDLRVR
jgi:hypothetical protein